MTTHGDGGKGSGRRVENTQAVRDNWDLIFNNKGTKAVSQEIKEHEMVRDEEDPQDLSEDYERSEGEWVCDVCGGPMYKQAHWHYAQCDDCGARQEMIDDDYL